MAGEHNDAISRVEDLIATLYSNSMCHMVQVRAESVTRVNTITDTSTRHICSLSVETRS